jgi:hypothetical protein
MNIFAISPDVDACARFLDDKRLIKMILETAQLLSNAIRVIDPETPDLYRATHQNHPCSLWVSADPKNLSWTIRLFFAYAGEYTRRFGKTHLSEEKLGDIFRYHFDDQPDPDNWVNCTEFKHIQDVHEAYKQALWAKWKNDVREPKWTGVAK